MFHSITSRLQNYVSQCSNLLLAGCLMVDENFDFFTYDNSWNQKQCDKIFEIGSMTKVYTTTILSQLVLEGRLDLATPIQDYLPELKVNKTLIDHPCTLRDLATHNSSLPTLPGSFILKSSLSPKIYKQPYMHFSRDDVIIYAKKHHFTGVQKHKYSNLGIGLLSLIMERVEGKQLDQLMQERIFLPLHMDSTSISTSLDDKLVTGHTFKGKEVQHWQFNGLEAAGAIRSNIQDQMKFLNANMHPDTTALKDSVQLAQKRQASGTDKLDFGLGWAINHEDGIIWHNGGTNGFNSIMAFHPQKKVGIILLLNYAPPFKETRRIDPIAFDILNGL